ncbi:vacuolar membrane protein KLLA0F03465g [Aspergillus udagawae]|uniref:Vacuolar membrane protein KLLA0F03465g n=1 Tax=Aspergillus udagawae TaxID=91492 RepID=A0A8H3NKZ3_9EURO|nr:uncharacterized protein Aud_009875 [Aspergillus udagawae]GFF31891.1 vacuolar membrane protein KLLA0F03465g [Aspergillus udagawae]GFF33607.1 vacuolar membrane protein KLLA0F03465g [Aspergillus udagawae]GFF73631.1 vacuolar membrane protein KLLA0F03465g [Aspergillus udagawae]GFG26266.1 vacuolar membrane protein KLLA0F03465g [Aspergillus udagawae]GIC93389.1 hypothetical protein Aud_009875 [Aspergillus udagawae]
MRFLNVGRAKPHQPSFTLLLFLLIVLLAQLASAQRNTNPDVAATTAHTTEGTKATDPATTDAGKTSDSKSTTDAKTTDASTSSETSTTEASRTTDASTTSTVSTTNLAGSTASSATSTDGFPVVTVPPTADAPYMQKSNTPEGTVFIAVGAALGLIGLSVLAWRGLVAWSVNRSVRRAALMHASEKKGLLRSKRKRSSRHSRALPATMSLEKLPPHPRNSYNPRASNIPSTGSGLFFSPTAGAGMHTSGNRGSSYLPAGYYAAGNAAPAGSQNLPYSTPEMRPHSQGYIRTKSNPSPPRSPGLSPSNLHDINYDPPTRHSYVAGSTSSLNLASPTHGRTPSAFLEDLFESHAPQSDNGHR